MLIYAGIDEAGYGPMFGPMVIARTVFRIEAHNPKDPAPDLWQQLESGVCTKGRDKRKRLAVNDSKKLYTPASGLKHLERTCLAFLKSLGKDPASTQQLLESIGHDAASQKTELRWYAHNTRPLPCAISEEELAIGASILSRTCQSAGVHLVDLSAAVLFEDRFNQMVTAMRSKARTAWTFVSQHLWTIWQQFGAQSPRVAIDRQGGRRNYLQPLKLIFENASLTQMVDTDKRSQYEITEGDRRMVVSFETKADGIHLPTALASMVAKYTRELCMERFNAFWLEHAPDLKPTAGYVQDGRRFLEEINTLIDQLDIPKQQLVRAM